MVTCGSSPGKAWTATVSALSHSGPIKKENKKQPDLSRFSCGSIPTGSRLPLITYKTTNLLITASHEEGGGDADNNYLHLHPWIEEIKPYTECQFLNRSIRPSFFLLLTPPSFFSIYPSLFYSFFFFSFLLQSPYSKAAKLVFVCLRFNLVVLIRKENPHIASIFIDFYLLLRIYITGYP